jgi:heptosyltransferase-2
MNISPKRIILRIIDRIIGPIIIILLFIHNKLFFSKASSFKTIIPQKILITKLVGLGDIILLLTILEKIKIALPKAEVHFLTTPSFAMVFPDHCPYVDKVITVDILASKKILSDLAKLVQHLLQEDYDAGIDFEQHLFLPPILLYLAKIPHRAGFYYYNHRALLFSQTVRISSNRHMFLDFYELARQVVPLPPAPPSKLTPPVLRTKNRANAQKWLQGKGVREKKYVIIHPGCGPSGQCRAWPKERYAQLVQRLAQARYAVFLSGTSAEKDIVDYIKNLNNGRPVYSLVDELDFYEFAALLDEAALLVTNDTGPMHLGAALRVPTLGLFGPENPERYKPYGEGNYFLYCQQPCSPCNHNYRGIRPHCRNHIYQKCMIEITMDMVERKVSDILSTSKKRRVS